jgi:hypothetical protein
MPATRSGRLRAEQAAAFERNRRLPFDRNAWPRSIGIPGRNHRNTHGAKPERIQRIVADWVEASVDPDLRKAVFVETLEQLREVIRGLYPKAAAGHVPSVLALNRVWGRRNQMLGLKTPEQSIVRIIDESVPQRVTTTDRIEAALRQLQEQRSPRGARS